MLHGAQLAVDITLRSATSSDGWPQPNAAHTNGAAFIRARRDKETKYAELVAGNRCHLVVIALETGGRWSDEAVEFVDMLGEGRAREAFPVLRRSVHLAWGRRWTRKLAVSCGLGVFLTSVWCVFHIGELVFFKHRFCCVRCLKTPINVWNKCFFNIGSHRECTEC